MKYECGVKPMLYTSASVGWMSAQVQIMCLGWHVVHVEMTQSLLITS